ncbi:hypothetical protein OG306_08460 [Streptomyces sp. NBC_01241]|uniref:hypothetical protein n=1 Tax=Streptomyces sp. NBC_01241 TaxID=2903794 RepID=UPI00352E5355|nr:hypothetical protein OG306_08460 [Streptomyces sp. NBC_01241]
MGRYGGRACGQVIHSVGDGVVESARAGRNEDACVPHGEIPHRGRPPVTGVPAVT